VKDIEREREREPGMLQRLLAKWRLWEEALVGIDDPHGDYLLRLEDRVRRLEGEVDGLRRHLSTDTAASVQSTDVPPTGWPSRPPKA
jgi:hypothetical protein